MQYNAKFINPYEVLGLPHASDFELVKATYRSLVKIYHPDVFKGDKEFAKERLSQLNAAYEFFSDEQQKREFDKSPHSQEKGEEQQDFDPEQNSDEFDEGIKILQENWDYASNFHPELKTLYDDLEILSKETAFALMAFVVETKKYKEAAMIAEALENAFLTTKFGDDPIIKQLAKLALQQGEIGFAKELNRALKSLGPESKDQILIKLSEHFPEFSYVAYSQIESLHLISPNHPKKKPVPAEDEDKRTFINTFNFFIITIIFFVILATVNIFSGEYSGVVPSDQVGYPEFVLLVEDDEVNAVTLDGENIRFLSNDGQTYSVIKPSDAQITQLLIDNDVSVRAEQQQQSGFETFILSLLPFLLLIGVWVYFMKRVRKSK